MSWTWNIGCIQFPAWQPQAVSKWGQFNLPRIFQLMSTPRYQPPPPDSPTEISSMADAELEEVSDFPCILSMRSLSEPDQASASCPAPATGWLARRP